MIANKILFYTFGKALELGGLALILFFIAGQVTPKDYALLMPYLLAISISTMIYSGLGGSFVKEFSLCDTIEQPARLMRFLSQSILISVVMSAILSIFFSDFEFLTLLLISVFANAFRSFGQSNYRAKLDEKSLVKFNFVYPIITILSYIVLINFTERNPVEMYMIGSVAGLLGSAFYVAIKYIFVLKPDLRINLGHWKLPLRHLLLNMSIFLVIMSDKFLVLTLEDPPFIGAYQLYENFSNLFYMGMSSVLFLCTPVLLNKFKENNGLLLLKYQILFSLAVVFTGLLYCIISVYVLQSFYQEYSDYLIAFFIQLLIKVSVILMYLPSVYYMYKNKELSFALTVYVTFLVFAGIAAFMVFVFSVTHTFVLLSILALLSFTNAIFFNIKISRKSEA
ncbi:hypothetical protein K6U51_13575 [Vibrio fluvialis]|uniref:hypothetical protein n=1 Tax=Vibrio fluvialis TaxID=676 RepID=UPI001C9C1CC0|nr:hypothetical protein [Vibrio fluvialis]EKO5124727.1 hypothetical protein [Vibrio fluvialis]MBY7911385.1 hypothetical protein [Vibrio fluvialis]MBY7954341.1 hypothetical protein [Vibrio fluvialis]MBY8065457.1 hypothetical protein [Vibrio fluvialis]MBY8134221.1 hypothetical protein [Vibrio fluvialis]